MEHLSTLCLVAFVSLVAAISPGPDFFVVVRNSLVYSRKKGFYTSFGVVLALLIHLTYTLAGIALLIVESPLLFNVIKYSGAAYLFYIGFKGIFSSVKNVSDLHLDQTKAVREISSLKALKQGFLTNMLNPKCAVFFVSLFSQFITPDTSMMLRISYGVVNWVVTFSWFLFLTYVITGERFKSKVNRFRGYIDRVMGGFLMALGLKIIFI